MFVARLPQRLSSSNRGECPLFGVFRLTRQMSKSRVDCCWMLQQAGPGFAFPVVDQLTRPTARFSRPPLSSVFAYLIGPRSSSPFLSRFASLFQNGNSLGPLRRPLLPRRQADDHRRHRDLRRPRATKWYLLLACFETFKLLQDPSWPSARSPTPLPWTEPSRRPIRLRGSGER